MSASTTITPSTTPTPVSSTGDELAALGWEINANQYRLVHLAARFDDELEWFRLGYPSASSWIAAKLQIQTSTAREWIRVGQALRHLPSIDAAFAVQMISYAKVRILTRWADDDNEEQLLELAQERTAGRLTVAIAKFLADEGETDAERDLRLHDERSFTTWTDADGSTVMRIVLPPSVAKPVVAAVDELVRRIAMTPMEVGPVEQPAPGDGASESEPDASADALDEQSVVESSPKAASMVEAAPKPGISPDPLPVTLRDMRRRWQPDGRDDWTFPSLGQQRADAFVALYLGSGVSLTTEVVVHVRGDGITFDDGTPTTSSAVLRQLDDSFVRLMIHDAQRRPVDASVRRRHPTTRQQRVVMETHGHERVDCQRTELLELDHNPPFERTRRTDTHELEPRCAPCHRARHRHDLGAA
jgi:Domain of unknown function (DUF222)